MYACYVCVYACKHVSLYVYSSLSAAESGAVFFDWMNKDSVSVSVSVCVYAFHVLMYIRI